MSFERDKISEDLFRGGDVSPFPGRGVDAEESEGFLFGKEHVSEKGMQIDNDCPVGIEAIHFPEPGDINPEELKRCAVFPLAEQQVPWMERFVEEAIVVSQGQKFQVTFAIGVAQGFLSGVECAARHENSSVACVFEESGYEKGFS